jgi:flagellar motor protein MotB
MTTNRLLSACLMAVATLSIVGCGASRNEKYATVEAQEADARIKELENLLAACESKKASGEITKGTAEGKSDGEIDGNAVGPNAKVSRRDHEQEVVITVDNAILFKPGKSELSATAKGTLARVATLLNEKYQGDDVRVDGFTDNQQITRSKDAWDDNWDLSGGRSRAVLHYLIERGVSAKRLSFAGYADNKSVASNGTDAGRAKNRRVEIVVLPNTGSASAEPEAEPKASKGARKKSTKSAE